MKTQLFLVTKFVFLVACLLFLVIACAPVQSLSGGKVVWQSTDGKSRVVQTGPCVQVQQLDTYASGWNTLNITCNVASPVPGFTPSN